MFLFKLNLSMSDIMIHVMHMTRNDVIVDRGHGQGSRQMDTRYACTQLQSLSQPSLQPQPTVIHACHQTGQLVNPPPLEALQIRRAVRKEAMLQLPGIYICP